MKTIFFDTETTGLLKPSINDINRQPYIVELYAVKVDDETFEILDEIDTYIKPPIPIPSEVVQIHGIGDEKVSNSPMFRDIADRIINFFNDADIVVAHNLPYDRSMIKYEMKRCDRLEHFRMPPKQICTVEKTLFIQQRRMNLSGLHQYCIGKPHENAHTAKADVFALVRCYNWLKENNRI